MSECEQGARHCAHAWGCVSAVAASCCSAARTYTRTHASTHARTQAKHTTARRAARPRLQGSSPASATPDAEVKAGGRQQRDLHGTHKLAQLLQELGIAGALRAGGGAAAQPCARWRRSAHGAWRSSAQRAPHPCPRAVRHVPGPARLPAHPVCVVVLRLQLPAALHVQAQRQERGVHHVRQRAHVARVGLAAHKHARDDQRLRGMWWASHNVRARDACPCA